MCCSYLRSFWKELERSFKIHEKLKKINEFVALFYLTTMIVGAILEIGNEKFATDCPYSFDKYIPRGFRLYVASTCCIAALLKCIECYIPSISRMIHFFNWAGIIFLVILKTKLTSTVYLLKYNIYKQLKQVEYKPSIYKAAEDFIFKKELWLHKFHYNEQCYISIFTENMNLLLLSSLVAWCLFLCIFLLSLLGPLRKYDEMYEKFGKKSFRRVITPPKLSVIDEKSGESQSE